MQLIVFQLISGVVIEVMGHLFGTIMRVWSEADKVKGKYALSPVTVRKGDREAGMSP